MLKRIIQMSNKIARCVDQKITPLAGQGNSLRISRRSHPVTFFQLQSLPVFTFRFFYIHQCP